MPPADLIAEAFARHRQRIERLAARILRDRDEARDVASETFVALIERGPADGAGIEPWLVTSARNRALNRARDRSRAARRALPPQTAAEIATNVGAVQAAALVREALDRLEERERRAIELRHVHCLGYEDVRRALGCSRQTARVIAHRARKRLRAEVIALLAARHDLNEDCRERVLSRAPRHEGCSACTAVSDELSALAEHGLAPLWPATASAFSSLLSRRISAGVPRSPSFSRLTEAFGALVLSVSLGAGSLPPVAQPASGPSLAVRSGAVVPTPELPAAPPAAAPTNRLARVGRYSVGDSGRLPVRPGAGLLDIPLHAADALAPELPPDVDIVQLDIWTDAGPGGEPEALHFRLTLAGPPSVGRQYFIHLGSGGCNLRPELRMKRPGQTEIYMYTHCGSHSTRDTVAQVNEGALIDVVLRFSTLAPSTAARLRPGTLLTDVSASSYGDHFGNLMGDHIPDMGEPPLSYRIASQGP